MVRTPHGPTWQGIDPCPLWDDDGKAYLIHAYANSRSGLKHMLRVCPMSPDGLKLLGDGEIIYHNPKQHPTLEGPKFLKRDGWYYILAPAGGVEAGWQVALRSRNIYGPYEDKIVLAQGDTDINGPHQGALVDTPDDKWWFVHFQDANVYGRITHLQPVEWKEGWPLMGNKGEPVLRHPKPSAIPLQRICAPQTSDDFECVKLGLQWQWQANSSKEWYSLAARPGWLQLYPQFARSNLKLQPNLLLQTFPARTFSAETLIEVHPSQIGEEYGLVVMGESYMALGVIHEGTRNCLIVRTDDETKRLLETTSNHAKLRLDVRGGWRMFLKIFSQRRLGYHPSSLSGKKGYVDRR